MYEERERKASFSPKVWFELLTHLVGIRRNILIIVGIILGTTVFDVCMPLMQAWLVDHYIEPKIVDGIWVFAVVCVAILACKSCIVAVLFRKTIHFELDVSKRLRNRIFSKYQSLSVSYFNDKAIGYLVAKTMSDTERISQIASWGVLDASWQILYIIGVFIPMLIINWTVSLMIMAMLPVAFLLSFLFQRRLLVLNREVRHANSDVSAGLNEGITGAKTSKTLNAEPKLNSEFAETTGRYYRLNKQYSLLSAVYHSSLTALGAFVTAIIIVYSGYNYHAVGMSLGDFTALLTYSFSLVEPVMNLTATVTNIIANQANAERVADLLKTQSSIVDSPEVVEKYGDFFHPKKENWEEIVGEIEFKNVSFKYEDDDRYILENFNLRIPAGASVAIVGDTGAGKTTIVNLACRFFEPTSGEILIDGVDYRQRSQLWLAHNLGYVLQTPFLFSGTIEENIKYARPEATDEEMERAARAVNADKVVAKLKDGYKSQTGECGDTLSTGEKQLVTFARAVLANPKIMVLDEATANIDTYTETLLQQAIAEILKERTTITIAHRLSTIKNSDIIVVVENGKIVEQGTHAKLMSLHSHYYNLYTRLFEQEAINHLTHK